MNDTAPDRHPNILVIDVGGSHIKLKCSSASAARKAGSGHSLTAVQMVAAVRAMSEDWDYDVISLGYPGPVRHGKIAQEPENLGPGWVSFDFGQAFGKPIQIINDAAMQALGSYSGGVMLFIGLGTGLGTALVADGRLLPLEMGPLPYKKHGSFEAYVGNRGRKRLGQKRWRLAVAAVVDELTAALQPDYVVLGGGNARRLKALPKNCRLGDNTNAVKGGFMLWANDPALKMAESASATIRSGSA